MLKDKTIFPLLIAIALVCSIIIYVMPKESFWVTDCGNKFIVMKNLELHGTDDISYPGGALDPDKTFLPDSEYHLNKTSNGVFSIFPSYFPALSMPLYKLFGNAGLYIIPFLCFLAILFLTHKIALCINPKLPSGSIVLVTAFGSPLVFYAFTFWEMTPAVMLSTIALLVIMGKMQNKYDLGRFAGAGVVLGLSIVLREEGYFLIAALFIAMAIMREKKTRILFFLIGCAVVILPLWGFQFMRYGHILGLHGSAYHSHNAVDIGIFRTCIRQLGGYWVYLLKFNSWSIMDSPYYLVLSVPFVLVLLLGIFGGRGGKTVCWLRIVFLSLLCIAVTILVAGIFTDHSSVLNCIAMTGLFPSVPVLALLLVCIVPLFRWINGRARLVLIASLVYIVMVCPILTTTDMGLIWGPRHFFIILPVLIPLSFEALYHMMVNSTGKAERRGYFVVFVYLCLLGVVIQMNGLYQLKTVKNSTSKLNYELSRKSDEVIVSDIYWLPFTVPQLYHKRMIFQVENDKQFVEMCKLLEERGIKKFTLVLSVSPMYRSLSSDMLKKYLGRKLILAPLYKVDLPGAEFYEVLIVRCRFP